MATATTGAGTAATAAVAPLPSVGTTTVAPMLSLAGQLEQLAGLGILLVSLVLAALSLLAWRRERDRRMLVVTAAYALFAVNGFVVFAENFVRASGLLPATLVELIEHASAFLILLGLLAFFFAIVRE